MGGNPMTAIPYTIDTLDQLTCDAPGCGHSDAEHDAEALWFHGRCHPTWPTWTRYEPSEGVVVISCSYFSLEGDGEICDLEIARIKVAQ